MPRGDKTGPDGMGPRTGRGMGFCNGYDEPGYTNPRRGRGFGRGLRRGFGGFFRRRLYSQPVEQDEKTMLEQEAKVIEEEKKALEEDLENVKKRLEKL